MQTSAPPGARPRHRGSSRASGSSARAARVGTARRALERVAVTGACAIEDRLVHAAHVSSSAGHHEGNNTDEPREFIGEFGATVGGFQPVTAIDPQEHSMTTSSISPDTTADRHRRQPRLRPRHRRRARGDAAPTSSASPATRRAGRPARPARLVVHAGRRRRHRRRRSPSPHRRAPARSSWCSTPAQRRTPATIQDQTWETFSENWNVDVRHVFEFARAALCAPLDPGSTVVSMSSGAARMGSPMSGGYAGAKATVSVHQRLRRGRVERAARWASASSSLLPKLTPATGLGSTFVDAYADYDDVDRDTFLDTLGAGAHRRTGRRRRRRRRRRRHALGARLPAHRRRPERLE